MTSIVNNSMVNNLYIHVILIAQQLIYSIIKLDQKPKLITHYNRTHFRV